MVYKIKTEKAYQKALATLESLLKKGFNHLTKKESEALETITQQIAEYESIHYPLPLIKQPKSIDEMIRLKMYERNLTQKELSVLLGIPDSRLSEVIRQKRKVNMDLAKRLHRKLGIDARFIIEKS